MRVQDQFIEIASELKDLYAYERFLKERIKKYEDKLENLTKLVDFASYMDSYEEDSKNYLYQSINETTDETTETKNYEI